LSLLLQALASAWSCAWPAARMERQARIRTRTQQRRLRSRQMDFEDSPEEAAFRAEVRSWLDANAKPRTKRAASDPMDERSDPDEMKKAKAWQKTKADKGYARVTWPKGMGG